MAQIPSTIDRVERLSDEEFRHNYLRPGRPVIITGAASRWPAISWTRTSIAARFGDDSLPVEVLDEDRARDNDYRCRNLRVETMPVRRYLEKTSGGGSRCYLAQVPLSMLSTQMLQAFDSIDYLPKDAKNARCFFWMGPEGSGSGLHFDRAHNFIVQLVGHKRWVIFPRDQCHLFDLPNADLEHFSPVNLDDPDLEKFPRVREATPIEFTLGPGDLLFLPAQWPHHVHSLDFSASVNCFFKT